MAKGIKRRKVSAALRAETKQVGGGIGAISAKEIAERTTPEQRHKWASTYMRAFDHVLKRRMGGV